MMERDKKREYLISLRESTGMNRKEFAIEFDIPYPTITDWELGHRRIPEYFLKALACEIQMDKMNKNSNQVPRSVTEKKDRSRTETAEFTVLCLLRDGEKYLLQDRVKEDWKGYTLPGGHVEAGESIVDAVIREMKEETGLTVIQPRLCGVKQFPIQGGRYIVFLFMAESFSGKLCDSDEGSVHWVDHSELSSINTVDDFEDLLDVMQKESLSEFQYVIEGEQWILKKK